MNEIQKTSKISKLAVFSLITPLLLFLGSFFLPFFGDSLAIGWILFSTLIGIILGVIALIRIRKSNGALKGRFFAISGIIVSLAILSLIIFVSVNFYYAVFHEKPYEEPDSKILISKIEKNCDLILPSNMDNIRTADKIAAGIDRSYVFILRYITDQNGFNQLKEQIAKDSWSEITVEFYEHNEKNYLYDLISGLGWQKNAPNWCKDESPKGTVYEGSLNSKTMYLDTICIEIEDSNKVEIVMMGFGNHRFKDANDIQ